MNDLYAIPVIFRYNITMTLSRISFVFMALLAITSMSLAGKPISKKKAKKQKERIQKLEEGFYSKDKKIRKKTRNRMRWNMPEYGQFQFFNPSCMMDVYYFFGNLKLYPPHPHKWTT